MTFTLPAVLAGVVAVMVLLLTTTTLPAAALPKVTVAPVTKFEPDRVTAVPPAVPPDVGVIEAKVGG